MVKIIFSTIICSIFLSAASLPACAQTACLTPEMEEALTVKRDMKGVMLYAVPEVSVDRINHLTYMLNRLLIRDDQNEGLIRQKLIDAQVTFLLFEDGEDLDEFEYDIENPRTPCALVGVIAVEVHYLGSLAEQHGMVDESFDDIAETVYYYGISKVYPDWARRLTRAQRAAYSDGRYNPHNAPEPEPRSWWDIEYLVIGLEVYYGYWKDKDQVRNGEFTYKSREEMQEVDPALFELIEELFPNTLYL